MSDVPSANFREDTATADPPAADQRSRLRHSCGTITLTRLSLPGRDRPLFAWVHDISEDGIGMDVLGPLGVGTDLVFEMKRGGEEERIRLYARVVHATPAGTFYRLGSRFTRPLRPWVLASILQPAQDHQAPARVCEPSGLGPSYKINRVRSSFSMISASCPRT